MRSVIKVLILFLIISCTQNDDKQLNDGIYDGKGKIEYDYDRSKSKYRTISYDGNWKNGTYNGKGELYVFDKNNSNNLNAFTKYNGLFVDGKKEGNFSVKGDFVKYVDSNYSFSYDCLYKNDVEISRKVNFDDGDKFIKLYNEQIEAQRAAERAEKQQKCNNCIIDWKKSTTPKDEYSLWIKIGRKSGEIVMLNGDIYKFDFENGKCKVINGWLVSDNYYPTFDNMIENIIEKCTEKYCR